VVELKKRTFDEVKALSGEEAVEIMRQAGIVGAGGGGFPTYFKYKNPQPRLIVNCTESEPGYWADKMVHREYFDEFLELYEREEGVYAALGLHPHEAGNVGDDDLATLSVPSPWIVKPIAGGSTIGLSKVDDPADLPAACRKAGVERRDAEIERARCAAQPQLALGQSIVLHTCLGPDDELISRASMTLADLGWNQRDIRLRSSQILGMALGTLVRDLLDSADVRRVIVAGGDTSYHVAEALGIRSLRMIAPTAPGSPLCLASAPRSPVDGREIVFKGGQVGEVEFLENVRAGALG
jgi:hypothetical protein